MKTMYIPKGKTVSYDTLATGHLVVNGCLRVEKDLRAKSISGSGVIIAGSISADNIRTDELETSSVTCKCLIAKRVQTSEMIVSESAAVSCFLSADYVEAGKLTVAASSISEVNAQEVIHLQSRRHSLFGLLLASALRSFWICLTAPIPAAAEADMPVEETEDAEEDPFSDTADGVFNDAL